MRGRENFFPRSRRHLQRQRTEQRAPGANSTGTFPGASNGLVDVQRWSSYARAVRIRLSTTGKNNHEMTATGTERRRAITTLGDVTEKHRKRATEREDDVSRRRYRRVIIIITVAATIIRCYRRRTENTNTKYATTLARLLRRNDRPRWPRLNTKKKTTDKWTVRAPIIRIIIIMTDGIIIGRRIGKSRPGFK